MPDLDLISGLIDTYRTLNHGLFSSKGSSGTAGQGEIREAVRSLRDSELRFSQALKERITGVPVATLKSGNDLPTIGTETANDTASMLLAQFGTARESTLAMLRDLPDEEWDVKRGNEQSIRERVFERLDDDRKQLNRIAALLQAA